MKRLLAILAMTLAVLSISFSQSTAKIVDERNQLLGLAVSADSDGVSFKTSKGFIVSVEWNGLPKAFDKDKYFIATSSPEINDPEFVLIPTKNGRPDKSLVLCILYDLYIIESIDQDGLGIADPSILKYRYAAYNGDSLKPIPKDFSAFRIRQADRSEIGLPIMRGGSFVQAPLKIVF